MFSKLFKSLNKTDFNISEYCTTDLHSHLIPGIDDGVKTLDESIEIISSMKELGFKKLITTPHIMYHRFRNTKEIILDGCKKVKEELQNRNIDIEVQASAEYYFDENFLELIEKDELLPFGDNYILFEMSYTSRPFGLEQTVFNLLSKGYKPVLAHPERYSFLNSSLEKFDKLKDSGLRFQLNLNSLIGFYGKNPRIAAKYLSEKGLVDFVGSDIHSMKYFDSYKKAVCTKQIKELFENNKIKNHKI
ncbi:MAG: capsular biosynthesis protein [Arcobacter sp.]|nr:MAG: capsular biosynthesis protein [Arcobacter sp.]